SATGATYAGVGRQAATRIQTRSCRRREGTTEDNRMSDRRARAAAGDCAPVPISRSRRSSPSTPPSLPISTPIPRSLSRVTARARWASHRAPVALSLVEARRGEGPLDLSAGRDGVLRLTVHSALAAAARGRARALEDPTPARRPQHARVLGGDDGLVEIEEIG